MSIIIRSSSSSSIIADVKLPVEIWHRILGYIRPSDYESLCQAVPELYRVYVKPNSKWRNRIQAYKLYVRPYGCSAPLKAKKEGETEGFIRDLYDTLIRQCSVDQLTHMLLLAVYHRNADTVRKLLNASPINNNSSIELWRALNSPLRIEQLKHKPVTDTHRWLLDTVESYRTLMSDAQKTELLLPSLASHSLSTAPMQRVNIGGDATINDIVLEWLRQPEIQEYFEAENRTHKLFIGATAARDEEKLTEIIELFYPVFVMVNGWDICLLHAVKLGNFSLCRQLLSFGADPHVHSDDPIKIAAKSRRLDLVRLLLAYGADMMAFMPRNSPNALLCAVSGGFTDIVMLMLDFGADIDYGEGQCLIAGVENCDLNMVTLLCDRGANVDFKFDKLMASAKGYRPIISLLREHSDLF